MTLAAALSLVSCATKPAPVSGNGFALLGNGASAYISLPVARNRELASLFAASAGEQSMKDALERTELVQLAAFPDGELRLVASGNFPHSLSSFAFPRSKGWKKTTVKGTGSWYTRDGLDAAIPQNGLACVVRRAQGAQSEQGAQGAQSEQSAQGAQDPQSARNATARGGIETVLDAVRNPSVSSLPGDFTALANEGVADGGIFLLVTDAAPWISYMLGPDVTLPVDYAIVSAFPQSAAGEPAAGVPAPTAEPTATSDVVYDVSVSVVAKDERSARAMQTLLRLAFIGKDIRAEGRVIHVDGIEATAGALVDFARNLYF